MQSSRIFLHPLAGIVPVFAGFLLLPVASAAEEVSAEYKTQIRKIGMSCRKDASDFCPGIRPGGGGILTCLIENLEKLSPNCQALIPEAVVLNEKINE